MRARDGDARASASPRLTPTRLDVLALTLLVIAGLVARVSVLGEPMRYDEAFTFLKYAMAPVGKLTATYDFPNNHILYSLLAHGSWRVFGDHLWTVRLPTLVAGVALIPAAYLGARMLYDRVAGVWAAALVTGARPLFDFSVDGRGYALGSLLVVLCLWLAARLRARARLREWVALSVLATLAVYTVPTMAFGVAAVAVWMVADAVLRRDRRDLRFVVSACATFGAAAAACTLLYSRTFGQPAWTFIKPVAVAWEPFRSLAEHVWASFSRSPHPIDWLELGGVATSLAVHRRIARHALPILLPAVAIVVVVFAIGQASPFRRTYVYLLPLYLIQAGGGLSYLTAQVAPRLRWGAIAARAAPVAIAGVLLWFVLHVGQIGAEQPPTSDNNLVAFLKRTRHPNEAVLLDPIAVSIPADYYLRRSNYHVPGLPPRRVAHPTVVVVRRGGSPDRAVRASRRTIAPGSVPRLIARLEYLDAYRVTVR